MSDTADALKLAFEKIGELAHQYGPPAIETAARVVQVNAIGDVIRAGGALLICLTFWVVSALCIRRAQAESTPSFGEGWFWGGFWTAIFGIVFFGGSLMGLLDIWTWVALADPKLALAHEVLSALAQKAAS